MWSLVGDVPTVYGIWGKHELDPGFREELMLVTEHSKADTKEHFKTGHYQVRTSSIQ